MRIRTIAIDGYGRFKNRLFDIVPGLQVVYGPNEQGKSTLRAFIGDMLYGQKRSPLQRLYHEDNELRCPWSSPDSYGGRLTYALDNHRSFEVFRRFDRRNESVQIFDRTHGVDITAQFEQLRNREPQFAQEHLGLSKEVFLSAATISHLTLDALGDEEAMPSIRERLLALADSGEEHGSAEATLRRLQDRISAVGTAAARTKPLPSAKARLAELRRENEEAGRLREDLSSMAGRRLELRARIAAAQQQRETIEKNAHLLERLRRAERLRQAERLKQRIDEVTQQRFTLGGVRDFPLERTPEVQRAANVAATARAQLDRTRAEREQCAAQLETERQRLGGQALGGFQDVPDSYDQRLTELGTALARVADRIEDIESARETVDARHAAANAELQSLPDFGVIGEDPETWLGQLIQSFRVAVRFREDEREKQAVLRKQIVHVARAAEEAGCWFADVADFASDAREYEVRVRVRDEQVAQLHGTAERLQADMEECRGRIPDFTWLSVLTAALLVGLISTAVILRNSGIYVAAVPAGLAALYFCGNLLYTRARTKRVAEQVAENDLHTQQLERGDDELCQRIEQMIVTAGCETIRELEGKYDQYRTALSALTSFQEAAEAQDRKTSEAEQRVEELFAKYGETFEALGEAIAGEDDVEPAALRALERYHAYRDARRRFLDTRELLRRHEAELARLQQERSTAREEERGLAIEARRLLRENGYGEESKQDNVLLALRSYRIRMAQVREKRGRIAVLEEKIAECDARLEREEADRIKSEEALMRYLETGRCTSLDEWHRRAEDARKYQELLQVLAGQQERLNALLDGETLERLRAAIESDGPVPESLSFTEESLAGDRQAAEADLDAARKEMHTLELHLAERNAAARPVSEIEEELADTELRVRLLEWELEAASYAMTVIEEIARDKHARMAPRLAAIAGAFLREITGGVYEELFISRDLRVSVRIPQTQQLVEDPERRLSKGTVDQIYLALRLAMVQCLSEQDERIPMLLDDPFANYDDIRLDQALRLLARLAQTNQILLFTCREDVVRAARTVNAPVLDLQEAEAGNEGADT